MIQVQALDTPDSDQGPSHSPDQFPDHDPLSAAAFRESQQLLAGLHNYISSEEFLATVERVQVKVAEESAADLDTVRDNCQTPDGEDTSHNHEWVFVKQAPEPTLESDFEMIENRDIIEAMAEFIAQSVAKMNETRSMPSRTIQYLLSSIFGDIRNKGMLAQFWGWGSFLYTAYGWSSYTLSIYRHPALLKLILQTIWSAAKWTIGRQ